jgi:hypothetical protein
MSEARALIADANLVEVGCSVWSTSIVGPDGDPVGGVVCRIDRWTMTDDDTGEILDRVTYRCRWPYGEALHYWALDGADVDPSAAEPLNRTRATKIVRRIAKALDRTKRGGVTPPLTASELEALADAYHLYAGGAL